MPDHIHPGPLMSQAVIHNGVAVLSGQVALDNRNADFQTQTVEVFARIDDILEEVKSGKNSLISVTIWLTDLTDFEAFNGLWLAWLDGNIPPARATVGAALALPGLKIEIQVTAAVDPSQPA